MTKDEILNYKVIKSSEVEKLQIDTFIKDGTLEIIDSFKNEYNELYVVFKYHTLFRWPGYKTPYVVAGDETGWELYDFDPKFPGKVLFKEFALQDKEYEELLKICQST